MPRNSYQYGTSPRKYEPEYTPRRTKKTQITKKVVKKSNQVNTRKLKERKEKEKREKKILEKKQKAKQIILVFAIFGMLFTISYREISIMEMFNQKKDMENKLALIEKENGQVEKSIKEVESTLDWNKVKQVATEQLGMTIKSEIPIDINKTDNVEVQNTYIKKDNTPIIEKIIAYFIK